MGEEPKKRMGWKGLLFLALVLFCIGSTIWPLIKSAQIAGRRTSALSGCKALAGGLVAFKHEMGNYPCPETREALIKKGATNLSSQSNANAYLAQLIVTEVIDSETYFHCEAGKGYHKGDDVTTSRFDVLAPGENSYAYVMLQGERPLRGFASITPIVIAPIVSGGSTPTFDPTLFGNYYVYGAVDGSGKNSKISSTGVPTSKGRDHFFQSGEDSLFGDEIPDVKIPIRKY